MQNLQKQHSPLMIKQVEKESMFVDYNVMFDSVLFALWILLLIEKT